MPSSTNKGYTQPTYGSETGTWGDDINNNFSGIVDNNLGGIASVSLSSSNVTLSASQAQNLVIKLSGTLSANITVYSPNVGFCIVENNTSGSYTVSFAANFGSGVVGSSVAISQGSRALIVSDRTVGARVANSPSIPSGSKTIFFQASAPVGWTRVTTYNDYAIRIVSGTGGGATAGSRGFSTAMGSITVDGHTLTIAEMPSHNHTDSGHTHPIGASRATSSGGNFVSPSQNEQTGATGLGYAAISYTGGGGPHSHTLSLGISYLDFILCSRN